MIFKKLNPSEIKSFQDWAWDFYKAGDPINELWHPVIQAECEKRNLIKTTIERFQADRAMMEEAGE